MSGLTKTTKNTKPDKWIKLKDQNTVANYKHITAVIFNLKIFLYQYEVGPMIGFLRLNEQVQYVLYKSL